MIGPFLLGIEGTRPSEASVRLLRETRAAGVLLLARNVRSPAQVRRLVLGLRRKLGRPLIVSIDHEGGWVTRFARGLTAFPGNAALGERGEPALARAVGRRMGLELKALGIRLNLAPVLDLDSDAYNPGLGIRSFGSEPEAAGRLGSAFIRGLQGAGVLAAAKHFPGSGPARSDPHLGLPVVRLTRRGLKPHLAPFGRAVRAGVACVMSSHVAYPALERGSATFSRAAIEGLLRRDLGFKGVAISDDLCMGAVSGRPLGESAVRALKAGHDLLILAHAPEAQREAAEAVRRAVASGEIPPEAWTRSQERLRALLGRAGRPPSGPLPKPDAALARHAAEAAVRILRLGRATLPLRPASPGRRLAVLWPDLREVAERFTFEGGPLGPERLMRRLLRPLGPRVFWLRVPLLGEPSATALGEAARADAVLFFCFEALRFPGQRSALLELRRRAAGKLVACLLREPKDARLLGPAVTALHAFGYRPCQLEALANFLKGSKT